MEMLLDMWSSQAGNDAQPFITYYDANTGERTELSGTTTRNWIAKTANLLVDECDADTTTRIAAMLPTHWLRCVWILATWTVGAQVVEADADIVLVGPDLDLGRSPAAQHRFASALLPFGARFAEKPDGFIDLGEALPGQSDAFFSLEPVDTTALLSSATPTSQRLAFGPGNLPRDIDLLRSALAGGGSLVFISHATEADFTRLAAQEQAQTG